MTDRPPGTEPTSDDRETDEIPALVSTADIGSASRSCLAIVIVLGVIAVLLVIFLVGTVVMN